MIDPNVLNEISNLRALLTSLRHELHELQTDYDATLIEHARLEKECKIAKERSFVGHFLLTCDCGTETLVKRHSPEFLMDIEMPHSLKWRIIFQQEDNPDIADFRKRMQDFMLPPEMFCSHIDDICEAAMKAEIKEDDWPGLFETLNIRNEDEQKLFRKAMEVIIEFKIDTDQEDAENRRNSKTCAHVTSIPREFTKEQIEELIKIDGFVEEMENITILKDLSDETKLKGEVVIIFKTHETAVKFSEKLNGKDCGNYVLHVKVY